jgi:predicted bacteriocin transport accessory protein
MKQPTKSNPETPKTQNSKIKKSENPKNKKRIAYLAMIVACLAVATLIYASSVLPNRNSDNTTQESQQGTDEDNNQDQNNQNDNQNNQDGQASNDAYSAFILIDNSEFNVLLSQKGPYFVFVGRPTCPHCVKFTPILAEIVSKNNKHVYHFNTDAARAEDPEALSAITKKLGISAVPALIKIENGQKVAELEDYNSNSAILNFLNS